MLLADTRRVPMGCPMVTSDQLNAEGNVNGVTGLYLSLRQIIRACISQSVVDAIHGISRCFKELKKGPGIG